ncbi:MAG: 50S ribosomal protein L24 [Candidatus Excrementavichristensenella sp.]|nr:50S ribosomal protein L24 [Bacillota bacterium]NLL54123.1 50S ribosomal protein L24 [Clostridiales bacterium]
MSLAKLHVKSGDTVVVISGTDKGKSGKIQKAFPKTGKVIVEGVAMVKRHQKPRGQGMPGGIVDKEAAIPACKVMLLCPACKKATRVGHKFLEDGKKKVRVCKKCGAAFDS